MNDLLASAIAGVVVLGVLAVQLAFYGAVVAVALWVALTMLQHFGVLMVGMGLVA